MSILLRGCSEDGLNLARSVLCHFGKRRLYFKHFEAFQSPLQRLEQGSAPSYVTVSLPVGIIATKPPPAALSKLLGQAVPSQAHRMVNVVRRGCGGWSRACGGQKGQGLW